MPVYEQQEQHQQQQHVFNWLHQVVDDDRESPRPHQQSSSSSSSSRKRRHQSQSPSPPPPSKRCRLRLPTPDMSTSTPSKRHASQGRQDEEETPRPPQSKRTRGTPSLPSRSSKSTTTTTASSTRSPVKSMIELSISAGEKAIGLETIAGKEVDVLGRDAFGLLSQIPKSLSTQRLVPVQLKNESAATQHFEYLGVGDDIYAVDDRDDRQIEREFDHVLDVYEASKDLVQEEGTEACWNEMVHYPVLQTALRGLDGVGWRNVTRAAVYPRDLASTLSINPLHPSSMVDYAIVLDLPSQQQFPRLWNAVLAQGQPNVRPTFNATALEYMCRRPIAVSIETKSGTVTEKSRADAQVFSCTALQIARFRQLAQGRAPVPTLPAIVVAGTRWNLYFVTNEPETNTFKMYGPKLIGGTENLIDIYKLLKSLRVVATWSTSILYPWWEKVLL
ncbi:uncharacterized protein J3D65DRAFT_643242 [Phyllosticta citribraziliensis]|uniref:PD-(D/E)XK nuclease-like domain-containing protein n=1 Tax=Phyllosticta citribraziliensis TaxID=989973 RepID=A0ABR1L3U6_9PEZI